MASLDEESTLLRGNAAPKYRTNLIVGALAAASFMFGVGVATTLDRNAARATRFDVYGQVDAGVEIAGKVTDQAGKYQCTNFAAHLHLLFAHRHLHQ